MRIVLYTSVLSPHILPFFRELAGSDGVAVANYVYTVPLRSERASLGWSHETVEGGIKCFDDTDRKVVYDVLRQADVLLLGVLDDWIMSVIRKTSVRVCYLSERWFKPPIGLFRILHPSTWKRILFLRELFMRDGFCYLAIGPHAAGDIIRLQGILRGKWAFWFKVPKLTFERYPMGSVSTTENTWARQICSKVKLWGYFVENSSSSPEGKPAKGGCLTVLWVGRMLPWKNVNFLVKAVVKLLENGNHICLRLVGGGICKEALSRLAGKWGRSSFLDSRPWMPGIYFLDSVPILEVRELMRSSDVYVLPSNGYEGWGAVVNEAMAEQCCVVGTKEAGSSATLITDNVTGFLIRSGDALEIQQCLLQLMNAEIRERIAFTGRNFIRRNWSPSLAASRLLEHIRNH